MPGGKCAITEWDGKPFVMTKARGANQITFVLDPQDPHFCNIEVTRKKSGQLVSNHYILQSDVKTWQSYYESQGYKRDTKASETKKKSMRSGYPAKVLHKESDK